MGNAQRVIAAVLVAGAAAVAGYTVGVTRESPREPLGVYILRAYPAVTRGRTTEEIGDLAAALVQRVYADEPTEKLVGYVQEQVTGISQDEALNVVIDVWYHLCPGAPAPNRNGEITPA